MYDCNNALHLKMLGSFEYRRSKEKKSPSAYGLADITSHFYSSFFYLHSRCR